MGQALIDLMELVVAVELLACCLLGSVSAEEVYIVYAGDNERFQPEEAVDMHYSMLSSVKGSGDEARESLLYSYKHSFNGFAAHLSPEEASAISEMEGVISVFPSKAWKMHTTRSWNFLGMPNGTDDRDDSIWKKAKNSPNVVIGVVESGVWPESESFKDDGMPPVPNTWKGICQTGDSFNSSHCNKKLIGARYFMDAYKYYIGDLNLTDTPDYLSPRDRNGHGTQTASTAAGQQVSNASLMGDFAAGTASGGAPMARLAVYKVCWPIPSGFESAGENTCMDADILAAIDEAVKDGVHVLSLSLGGSNTGSYFQDSIALGSLHAVKKGILVACSAGNDGPDAGTSTNLAPWIVTVAANSVDREFPSPVVLGNGDQVKGQTVTPYRLEDKLYSMVFARDAVLPTFNKTNITAMQCIPGSLDPEKVKDKIVFCLRGNSARVEKGLEVKRAGGAGVILGNLPENGGEIAVDPYVLPGTAVASDDTQDILAYINSTYTPTAQIIAATTVVGTKPAPFMASFSSKGPNVLNPNIIKPDISAPGVNILAAWSEAASPTSLLGDDRHVKYNLESGTSMSCPHVAGIAALLKAIHPDWSPAAIKSAIMTTAVITDNEGHPISEASGLLATPFNYGSGQVNPNKASDPGLVYDATYDDYIIFLCSSGIDVGMEMNTTFKCPQILPKTNDLNYPSIAIGLLNTTENITRTVTNVGGKSEYTVSVDEPPGVSVDIYPQKLSFQVSGENQTFTVMFTLNRPLNQEYVFGSYTWSDGDHNVTSPIAVSAM